MKVFKFGGAAAATPSLMNNLVPIIKNGQPKVIVLSAIGKNTNALENIFRNAIEGKREKAEELLKQIEEAHFQYIAELFHVDDLQIVRNDLNEYFTELNWALDDAQIQSDDYVYDQIVCIGELVASKILYHFLRCQQFDVCWVDIRDVIKTDESYRHAVVLEDYTQEKINNIILPLIQEKKLVVTQGFIGSSMDNNSTTLGREGSDYSASIIAAGMNAKSVTIWKDVPGFLSADPKDFNDTVKIQQISYHEVIELAFYGAQIIHPKTIKPIQNKNIPLFVKSFIDPTLNGTIIEHINERIEYPPLKVLKKNQTMIQITTLDFSFIDEKDLTKIYEWCAQLHLKINLIQHTAISLVLCVNHEEYKVLPFLKNLQKDYKVLRNEALNLLTIRHYKEEELKNIYEHQEIILEQRTRNTLQVLFN